jgi:hypothetical protein
MVGKNVIGKREGKKSRISRRRWNNIIKAELKSDGWIDINRIGGGTEKRSTHLNMTIKYSLP